MSDQVLIFEMGPRDGLQNEKQFVETADKVKLINDLVDCGFRKIEVASFVSPKWVPQMADAEDVVAQLPKGASSKFAALTPNVRGLTRALGTGLDEVAVFASASEAFSQKNINCSIEESLARYQEVLDLARENDMPVRGYVSCVTDCPYTGAIDPSEVARVAKALIDLGCYEISLGDTIGKGTPETVNKMLDAVLDVLPAERLAGHFHDTSGRAIENIAASLARGVRVFDSSVGGLGGCPYAPGASGNVATEAVVAFLHGQGIETGIDVDKLAEVGRFAKTLRTD